MTSIATAPGATMAAPDRRETAGAVIVDEYAEKDYGGAGYSCHDPEGHLWYFGSCDPRQPGPA